MGRNIIENKEALLTYHIQARINQKAYDRLNDILQNSNCHSLGELARKILSKERFICYYRDTTLDIPVEELITIAKELNAIGVNINQITKHFHAADTPGQKMFHALKVSQDYNKVGVKVDRLLTVVFELSKKWLHEYTAGKTSGESSATMSTK